MHNKPLVTVVIPFYRDVKYLFAAIRSVLMQTYKNFEILLIYDNECKDDLDQIKKFIKLKNKYTSSSIKIHINKKNLGAGYSRNIGIKKSTTKYIAFLDSDDIWLKNKLETQINYMEKNDLVFSHTSYFIINEKNKIVDFRKAKKFINFEYLLKSCDVGLSTVVVKSQFLKKNKYYFSKIRTKEDFVLWLKIVHKIDFLHGINKKLTYYRKTNSSLSSNKIISLINGYKVYRKHMGFSIAKSIYFLFILSINFIKKNLKNKKKY